MEGFMIQNISVKRGEKKSDYIQVNNSDLLLPITIICGHEKGKTLLITGGIHNSEYVGIQAAIELAQEIDPMKICGNIIILPLINRSGFENRTMSLTYEDEKNLNREFPGKEDGTLSEKITYFMETELFKVSDFYIDLHSGDGYEKLTPYVYCQGKGTKHAKEWSKKMAKAVNVPYIVESQSNTGGAYNYAGSIDLPGILIERGAMGTWSKEEVQADKKDVINIINLLQMKKDDKEALTYEAKLITNVIYENSKYTGCWYPNYNPGDYVNKGDKLGTVKDYFGNELDICIAKDGGVILYQTESLSIIEGGPMIAYGLI